MRVLNMRSLSSSNLRRLGLKFIVVTDNGACLTIYESKKMFYMLLMLKEKAIFIPKGKLPLEQNITVQIID
jgi:hypothetical protein